MHGLLSRIRHALARYVYTALTTRVDELALDGADKSTVALIIDMV